MNTISYKEHLVAIGKRNEPGWREYWEYTVRGACSFTGRCRGLKREALAHIRRTIDDMLAKLPDAVGN